MAATAAAAIGFASPANANITLSSYNGPDLATQVKASTTDTSNDVQTVWGCTQNDGACANVSFTGYQQGPGFAGENIHITGGAGFASITDSPNNATNNLYNLIIDPTTDFNQYMFSIQLVNDGTVKVYYLLAGGSGWNFLSLNPADPSSGISQNANANNTYLVQGGVMSAIMISSTSPIKEFKQNSITFGSIPASVPEPATWAMMLVGFGGIGMAMRRSRRRKPSLMQIA